MKDVTELYIELLDMTPEERMKYLEDAKKKYEKHLIGAKREKAGKEVLITIKNIIAEHIEIYSEEAEDPENVTGMLLEEYREILDDTPEFWEAIKEYVEWII